MAKFSATVLIVASLISVVYGAAEDFPFPDTIAVCGKGKCSVVGVIKNEAGFATGIGPVPADATLGLTGDYPSVFSLCGLLTCVTVPVVKEESPDTTPEDAAPVPGMSTSSTCPTGVGMCGDGACKVAKVNTDASGAAVSVGPVDATGPQGSSGAYPDNVGVCCDGVCRALPVLTKGGNRKLL